MQAISIEFSPWTRPSDWTVGRPPPLAFTILAIQQATETSVDMMGTLYSPTHESAPIMVIPLARDTQVGPSSGFIERISVIVQPAH
ncbi:hypothetical protein Gorai_017172 [Gossypium raimondii]|uniref:Uncharacterized protein n=1 Tax=Gossypium raimondii TaxID=29730 RepID=A0A0D2NG20_GOSRA|nr:hypothetical protein B456_005G205000 [Gossypium raimondii]MBA0586430.1 hypothetical protein [Gossypium raimondii]